MPHSTSSLTIQQLGPTFACEVTGADFSKPLTKERVEEFREIFHKYGVTIMRRSIFDDQTLIDLARNFGPLDDIGNRSHAKAGRKMRVPQYEVYDISNLDADGKIVTAEDKARTANINGNALFHADGSFNPHRTGFSMLRAQVLPPKGSGGETEFLDCRAAYEDLSTEMKEKIENLVGCHSLLHNRKTANPDDEYFKQINVLDHPLGKHKIVQVHEPTGRKTLYVTSYTHHIDGMPIEEGQLLLKELFDHAKKDKYKFVAQWEETGDVIVWDNTCVLHRATHGDFEKKYVRDMRRVSTFDTSCNAYGLNDPNKLWNQGVP